ncbi:hypothetical protein SDRG_04090 [Saprolegnia diclina VS20]|uniref:Protein RFT1 homolog n=1 Tax=Saprolegnia diclina (strain VS20) TaxID=1156394 RepID=T0S0D1_SAPDV|nr:hypothetical protein SDRG_04090 [Saprolegnia diclina VS20]EQC38378.1 hypothetical protein SDRG_04090 [Saprolegnia diclina VS20]|eukprot:XP_008607970.1 hypothetical protein SDRG_04090 [Saprolegnia diclina VS20]
MGVAEVIVAGGARMLGLSFLQKGGTFVMNMLTLRRLPVHLSGVSLSLELVLSTTFIVREGLRLASLREENLSEAISLRKLLNTAWVSTFVGILCTLAAALCMAPRLYDTTAGDYDAFQTSLWLFCLSAAIEYLTEPLYIVANASLNFPLRVQAQGWGFFTKAVVQVVLVVVFDVGMVAFGFSQVAFAVVHGLVYLQHYYQQLGSSRFPLTSILELLPSPRVPLNLPLLTLWATLFLQSCLKYLLTEGDKLILSAFESYQSMGAYSVAFNIGSLAPRLLFLPIEDASKAMFSKLLAVPVSPSSKAEARTWLLRVLQGMTYVGLIFVCFGTNYARTALYLLAGYDKAQGDTPVVLAMYFVYVYFLGLNGICEAFVHAVGDKTALQRLNSYLVFCFVVTTASAVGLLHIAQLGNIGIVLANCINMTLRIGYCFWYMVGFFQDATIANLILETLPPWQVSLGFAAAMGLTFVSEGVARGPSLAHHALHVGVGGGLFVIVLILIWRFDPSFVQLLLRKKTKTA